MICLFQSVLDSQTLSALPGISGGGRHYSVRGKRYSAVVEVVQSRPEDASCHRVAASFGFGRQISGIKQ